MANRSNADAKADDLSAISAPVADSVLARCPGLDLISTLSHTLSFCCPGAKFQYRIDQCIDVARLGAMVEYGRSYCQAISEHSCGRRRNAGLVQISHDLCIQLVRIFTAIAETDNIKGNRGKKFQFFRCRDLDLEVTRQLAGPRYHCSKRGGSVNLEGEPRLQRTETT